MKDWKIKGIQENGNPVYEGMIDPRELKGSTPEMDKYMKNEMTPKEKKEYQEKEYKRLLNYIKTFPESNIKEIDTMFGNEVDYETIEVKNKILYLDGKIRGFNSLKENESSFVLAIIEGIMMAKKHCDNN